MRCYTRCYRDAVPIIAGTVFVIVGGSGGSAPRWASRLVASLIGDQRACGTSSWARQGSNLRPLACKASALPLSYAPRALVRVRNIVPLWGTGVGNRRGTGLRAGMRSPRRPTATSTRSGRRADVGAQVTARPSTRARAASTSSLRLGDAATGCPGPLPRDTRGSETERSSAGEAGETSRPQSRHETAPRALARCVEPQPAHRSRMSDHPVTSWHGGQNRTCSPSTTARRHGLDPRAGSVWRM